MNKSIYSSEHKFLISQLKKVRIATGLNQSTVAKLLDKTQSYISKIESGERRIDIVQLKEFARIYKKKVDFFIK